MTFDGKIIEVHLVSQAIWLITPYVCLIIARKKWLANDLRSGKISEKAFLKGPFIVRPTCNGEIIYEKDLLDRTGTKKVFKDFLQTQNYIVTNNKIKGQLYSLKRYKDLTY